VLELQDGPTIVAGHSYGGQIVTALGTEAQQPLAGSTFTDVMGVPAWRSLPSWYLVAEQDQAIPPDAERLFASRMGATTVKAPAGHLAMVTHPTEVAQLISTAAGTV
jgi:pimeloyl-ACP methyl ester carboxylesterase